MLVQAVLTGTSIVIGYGIGLLVRAAFRLRRRRTGWFSPSRRTVRTVRAVVIAVAVVLLTVGSWTWWHWQQSQRRLVGMTPLDGGSAITLILVAGLVVLVILGLARLVAAGSGRLTAAVGSRVGLGVARTIAVVAWVVVAVLLFDQLVVAGVYDSTKATFATSDPGTDPGVVQPTSTDQSGGPGSLTPWDTLGRQGRNFAGDATTVAALHSFAGPDAKVMEPIRAYVGLRTAPTPEARSALPVEELRRTGAFSQRVLVVATGTATATASSPWSTPPIRSPDGTCRRCGGHLNR